MLFRCAATCVLTLLVGAVGRAEDVSPPPSSGDVPAIQFESDADVDWRPYSKALQASVRPHWRIPDDAKRGARGAVTVHFFVARDGVVTEVEIVRRRGRDSLVEAARAAVAEASPVPAPPLPPGEDRVGVTWSFFYNMDQRGFTRWKKKLPAPREAGADAR